MTKTLLEKLKTPVKYIAIDGVDLPSHPDDVIEDLLSAAANEIERLRDALARIANRSAFDTVLEMKSMAAAALVNQQLTPRSK